MRPLHWWLRITGFSRGAIHFVWSRCLRHVEETVVPVTRPCVGGSMSSRNTNDGRLSHRLGSGHEWSLCPRSEGRSPSHVAHQFLGDGGSISSFETLSPRPERPSCASAHRQYVGGLLHIGWLFCVSRDLTMSILVLSNSSSSIGAGCHGTDMAKSSYVRLPLPIALFPGVLE